MGKLTYATSKVQSLLDKIDGYPQSLNSKTVTELVSIDNDTIKRTSAGVLYVDSNAVGGGGGGGSAPDVDYTQLSNKVDNLEDKVDNLEDRIEEIEAFDAEGAIGALSKQVADNAGNISYIALNTQNNASRITKVEQEIAELKGGDVTEVVEDITAEVGQGYFSYSSTTIGSATTITKSTDGGWRCLSRTVKAGEKYYITGTGGGGARLYCVVNTDSVILTIAASSAVETNKELIIEEDGTLYCSFNKNNTYKVERKYLQSNINISETVSLLASGAYNFGRTCDFDYTAPTIGAYSLPSTGKVATIYGWYDGLVSTYPQYVSRENCDTVMASLGVSKPSAIASLPMYMYKFIPPKAPNANGYSASASSAQMIKALVLTGTHNEFTAVWDCYNAMRLICEEWAEDKNLEELRWNAELYIIPCYNLYGSENAVRTNENGIDLNRNAPTSDWKQQGSYGDSTYSGMSAGSEYSTKVMMHYLSALKPQVFVDHHNTNVGSGTDEGEGKNMIYTHCIYQAAIDLSSVLISQMTRKWKQRYSEFPSVESEPSVLFGYTLYDHIRGSIGKYAAEQGALGSTYESNFGILYKNGVYSTSNRQTNNAVVSTCATEGFLNYLLRSLKTYSDLAK